MFHSTDIQFHSTNSIDNFYILSPSFSAFFTKDRKHDKNNKNIYQDQEKTYIRLATLLW